MTRAWIDGEVLSGIKVEKQEGKRPGGQAYIPLDNPKVLIVHTTEGSSVAGAVGTLRANFSAPHFVVGEGRIVQMRPLTGEAATVRNHNDIGWQVESVGSAKQTLHELTPGTWAPLVAVAKYLHEAEGLPYRTVDGWKDDLSDINGILASNNTRRQSRKALGHRGFVMHLDIPDQDPTWHWDCGALNFTKLFADASGEEMTVEQLDKYIDGGAAYRKQFKELGGKDPGDPPASWDKYKKAGWADSRFAATNPKAGAAPAPGDGLTKPEADELYAAKGHEHAKYAEDTHTHSEGTTGPAIEA